MPRKALCVCSLVNKLGILYGNQLEGEIYFKHSPKCKSKTSGTYEFCGAGFKKGKAKLDNEPSSKGDPM